MEEDIEGPALASLEERPAYMPLHLEDALEVITLGGFTGVIDLTDENTRNAVAAAYNKGVEDGKFIGEMDAEFGDPDDDETEDSGSIPSEGERLSGHPKAL